MIVGLGSDLVDVGRFRRAVERHGDGFLEGLFSAGEIGACRRKRRCTEHLAALFAAREAALKALGTGLVEGMSWKDMEVLPGPVAGVYRMRLDGAVGLAATRLGATSVHLAITTTREVAGATVILAA